MDGWQEFLNARMRCIKDGLRQGMSGDEIMDQLNMAPMQFVMLSMRAREELDKEKS